MEKAIAELEEIFRAAVERVDPYGMIRTHLSLSGDLLSVRQESGETTIDLCRFKRILVIGTGKATAKMALAVEELLGDRLSEGLIVVKRGHTEELRRIRTIEAGHPVPDEESVRGAAEMARLCEAADEATLIIGLISGGGSACLSSPREWEEGKGRRALTLAEQQEVTQLLLSCGADIGEINTVRKHLSNLKGGGLARAMFPATSINLILSDVVGDRLDAIASGLTVGDPTTYADADALLRRYGIVERLPASVRELLRRGVAGQVAETPKPGDPLFERVTNVLLGTNRAALSSACERARELGYNVVPLSSQITGEAREIAKFYLGIAFDLADHGLAAPVPACVIGGGETTVTLRGEGQGGRNQEMALSFLRGLAGRAPLRRAVYFLSAGTDGNDGPTDAAGAFACNDAAERAKLLGLDIDDALSRNDSYNFFDAVGYLFKPGPTNTNVCDLQLLLVR